MTENNPNAVSASADEQASNDPTIGSDPSPVTEESSVDSTVSTSTPPNDLQSVVKAPRSKGPSRAQQMNKLYQFPTPIRTFPLPLISPTNPLSILVFIYTWISQVIFAPSSHPEKQYQAWFSPETRSVHVTDPKAIRALWEQGFYGKGTLSRSDPSWHDRELRKKGVAAQQTSEEVTQKRRAERQKMKLERARKESEAIEETKQREREQRELESTPLMQDEDDGEIHLRGGGFETEDEEFGAASQDADSSSTTGQAASNGEIREPVANIHMHGSTYHNAAVGTSETFDLPFIPPKPRAVQTADVESLPLGHRRIASARPASPVITQPSHNRNVSLSSGLTYEQKRAQVMANVAKALKERELKEKEEADRAAAAQAELEKKQKEERAQAEKLKLKKEQEEALNIETERVEAERIAAEKAEAKRVESERLEAERVEAARVAAEKAEAERIESERRETERLEAERAEVERIAAEKAEAKRVESERLEAERVEAARVAAEKVEAAKIEAQRLEAEKIEAARVAAEETERIEAERVETERVEAERVEAEKIEIEIVQTERAEAARIATEKAEAERIESERRETERLEAERAEAERAAAEKAEAERIEADRLEAQRVEAERLAARKAELERLETQRVAIENAEARKFEAMRAEVQRLESERIEAEDREAQRLEAERVESERVAAEKAEADRLAFEEAERERKEEAERLEAQRIHAEKLENERLDRIESERVASEKAEAERVASEKAQFERQQEAERIETERIAAEKAEVELLAAKAREEEAARLKAEEERLAVEQAEKEEAARLAAAKAEEERLAIERAEKEEAARSKAEEERLAIEKAEKEEAARLAAEKAEQERLDIEKAEKEEAARLASEKAQAEEVKRLATIQGIDFQRIDAEATTSSINTHSISTRDIPLERASTKQRDDVVANGFDFVFKSNSLALPDVVEGLSSHADVVSTKHTLTDVREDERPSKNPRLDSNESEDDHLPTATSEISSGNQSKQLSDLDAAANTSKDASWTHKATSVDGGVMGDSSSEILLGSDKSMSEEDIMWENAARGVITDSVGSLKPASTKATSLCDEEMSAITAAENGSFKSVRFSPNVGKATFSPDEPTNPGTEDDDDITASADLDEPEVVVEEIIEDKEHLQLTLEESFFLNYGFGVLDIMDPNTKKAIPTKELFALYRQTTPIVPAAPKPDDPFVISYVAYHHFRSLGWVVRGGIKFGVDYLLYNRGPPFSHAEFAITILPAYTDAYWSSTTELETYVKQKTSKSWSWLHCVNRVNTQVKKTLILVYVDVPAPLEANVEEKMEVTEILARYKIREVVLKRWSANRSRD